MPLGEAAYRRLRADIVSCRLAPGQRLTERGLTASTGLGVASIRAALTRLDQEGLVRTLPRRGYQVAPLTIKAVSDLFSFWSVIGPQLVRLGVAGATDGELAQTEAGFRELRQVISEPGPAPDIARRSVAVASRVFRTLAEATRNQYFIDTFTRVDGEMFRVWTLLTSSQLLQPGQPFGDLGDWPDTLARRDGDTAASLTRQYIEQAHQQVLRTLAQWPSVITTEVAPLTPERGA